MKRNKDLVARVCEMEERFDELTRILGELDDAISACERFKPDLEELRNYLDSGRWQKDFEADEAGRIPSSVKRGVLSEDGLYNALQDADELLARARKL